MGNLCISHSVLLSLIKIAQKHKSVERKWAETRREREGKGEGSQGEQNEGRKEERQEEKERKTM